jgi:signal transduction histidine kinase
MNDLKGAGHSNIQARVAMLNGKMNVETAKGTGTTFIIECSAKVENT